MKMGSVDWEESENQIKAAKKKTDKEEEEVKKLKKQQKADDEKLEKENRQRCFWRVFEGGVKRKRRGMRNQLIL